jgi:cold shock CspA family protein
MQKPEKMLEGIVTEWRDRGFGFIEFSENGARICRAYVHSSHCEGVRTSLVVGQVVHAVVVPDDRNPGKFTAQKVKKGPLGQSGVVVEWNSAEVRLHHASSAWPGAVPTWRLSRRGSATCLSMRAGRPTCTARCSEPGRRWERALRLGGRYG